MSYSVLVATPTVAFGDLIQHTLEELGHFDVKMAYTISEALLYAGSIQCAAAILDGDLGYAEYRMLAERLTARFPDIRLIIFPPENDLQHPSLAGLPAPALLSKPFYLPDLIELVSGMFVSDQVENAEKQIAWLDAPSFDRLMNETTARVGIVCSRDGAAVLAGHTPEGTDAELKELARRFWMRAERTDLVRFDRLEAGQLDCLLFLTAVTPDGEIILGLVFPVSTPLSKVRAQASPLVQALRERKVTAVFKPPEIPDPKPAVEEPAAAAPPAVEQQVLSEPAAPEEDTRPVIASPEKPLAEDALVYEAQDAEMDWEGEEAALKKFSLADMLGSIPSPDPNGSVEKAFATANGSGWLSELLLTGSPSLPQNGSAAAGESVEEEEPVDPDINCPVYKEEQRLRWEQEVVEVARNSAHAVGREDDESLAVEEAPHGSTPLPQTSPLVMPPASQATALAETEDEDGRADVLSSLTNLDQLEPVAVGMSQLNYTCVLIPRLPGHFLAGELSEKLTQWVQQLCLAFGWRLEGIALRPEYLQWTVQVTPSISPGNVVKIIRQRTSDYIFEQFESLRRENPSGDFWANGYLIVSGAQPPSVSLLRDYIAQTRRRQGVGRIPGDHAPRLTS